MSHFIQQLPLKGISLWLQMDYQKWKWLIQNYLSINLRAPKSPEQARPLLTILPRQVKRFSTEKEDVETHPCKLTNGIFMWDKEHGDEIIQKCIWFEFQMLTLTIIMRLNAMEVK